jgi:hypothetical protein
MYKHANCQSIIYVPQPNKRIEFVHETENILPIYVIKHGTCVNDEYTLCYRWNLKKRFQYSVASDGSSVNAEGTIGHIPLAASWLELILKAIPSIGVSGCDVHLRVQSHNSVCRSKGWGNTD